MHQKYNMKPKEPDKYTTFKISLRNILLDPEHQQTIFTTVERVNLLTIHLYHMLRLWALTQYDAGKSIIITSDLIRMAYRSLLVGNRGRKPNKANQLTLDQFQNFYRETYQKLVQRFLIPDTYKGIF